jgi:hypothetical protein
VKTIQAVGVGFGVTVGVGLAGVMLVMCGAAVRSRAEVGPTPPTSAVPATTPPVAATAEARSSSGPVAGWVLFDGNNLALCRTQTLKDTTEPTLAAAREKMLGWTPLPSGSNCGALGGSARASCTGSDFHTVAYHYVGASAFGHVEALRKSCIQNGNAFKADF